jgi:hypothetical protein
MNYRMSTDSVSLIKFGLFSECIPPVLLTTCIQFAKKDRKLRPRKENSNGGGVSSATESCKVIEGKGRNDQHYKMREYTTN